MKTRKPTTSTEPPARSPASGPPGTMQVPVRQVLRSPRPQPKLTVSRPGDASEREADQVADHVMRLPGPAPDRATDLQHAGETSSEGVGTGASVPETLAARLSALGGRGEPLAPSVRSFFEPRFGRDLGGVRLHTDPAAGELARSLDARAFTLGSSIVFGPGEYRPGNAAGRHLIAHELTHVLQQAERASARPTVTSAQIRRRASVQTEDAPIVPSTGRSIGLVGIVDQDGRSGIEPGLNLRGEPSEDAEILRRLPHNTPLFVQEEIAGGWYFVVARDDGSVGYVARRYVNTSLPDPGARLHRIGAGETALTLARRFFDPSIYRWGADARFYVNVLALVNRAAGRTGIRKPSEDSDWDQTEVFAGSQIWIPSVDFAQSLRGQVASGSLSYEAWERLSSAASRVVEFLAGTAAFVGGLVVGALEAVWDAIAGIAHMAWGIFRSLISGSILSDARELMHQLSQLDPGELAMALGDWLDARWNHPQLLRRWYWRGWIIGYVIAEVLMLIFSGGVISALKWASKTSKVAALVRHLAPVARLSRVAENTRRTARGSRLAERMRGGTQAAFGSLREARAWAERTLRLPSRVLRDLTFEAIEQLRRLPQWAIDRLRPLGPRAKRWLLGCASACRVDIGFVQRELRALRGGAELAAGFATEHAAAFARFLARPLTHGEVSDLARVWRSVERPGDVAHLTLSNSRRLFNNHRRRFWRAVQDDATARSFFERAGCRFGARGSAPFYDLPDGRRIRMTIDHIAERQSAWGRALDPSNLRIVFERENTVMLRLLHQLDPFQRH
jgi:hypothetical protein